MDGVLASRRHRVLDTIQLNTAYFCPLNARQASARAPNAARRTAVQRVTKHLLLAGRGTRTASSPQVPAMSEPIKGVVIHQYSLTVRGVLVRRYKRFLADVVFEENESVLHDSTSGVGGGAGSTVVGEGRAGGSGDERNSAAVTCHCPNTGPMTGLLDWPLAPVVCSVSNARGRKYTHTLEMIQCSPRDAWVGVHSALANRLVEQLLMREDGPLRGLLGEWKQVAKEVPYGSRGSRVDFILTRPTGRRVYVEVKSVTLAEPYSPRGNTAAAVTQTGVCAAESVTAETSSGPSRRIALFPDTVSVRARRHVEDLMEVVAQGHEAVCVFVIQRDDCEIFAPCAAKDPTYARLVRQAAASGVRMLALRTSLQPPAATANVAALSQQQPPLPTTAAAAAAAATRQVESFTGSPASINYLGPAELDLEYGSVAVGATADVMTATTKRRSRDGRRMAAGQLAGDGLRGSRGTSLAKRKPSGGAKVVEGEVDPEELEGQASAIKAAEGGGLVWRTERFGTASAGARGGQGQAVESPASGPAASAGRKKRPRE